MQNHPRISFIVPAHNEEALIGRTLAALHDAARALGDPYEIVVADDASTDRTGAIAREHGARVVAVNRRQIAATRNAGAHAALGDRFVFVDADTVVSAAVVRAAMKALRGGAVGGGAVFRFDGQLPAYAVVLQKLAQPVYRAIGLASGCFIFCTRRAFRAAGGFNERLFAAEELDFSQRMQRVGQFVILRECVTTSGRKLRAHHAAQIFSTLTRLALNGPRSFRRREGLEMWYGPRTVETTEPRTQ
jgi:glycosyltransferase involved in cell wall biosynthesis